MSEFPTEPNFEAERERGIDDLVAQYFPEDREFVADMDESDKIGFIYGQLLELGEDPEGVLHEFGITEETMTVIEVKPNTTDEGVELGGATSEI